MTDSTAAKQGAAEEVRRVIDRLVGATPIDQANGVEWIRQRFGDDAAREAENALMVKAVGEQNGIKSGPEVEAKPAAKIKSVPHIERRLKPETKPAAVRIAERIHEQTEAEMAEAKASADALRDAAEAEQAKHKAKGEAGRYSPVLNPGNPYSTAGEFIRLHCMLDGLCIMWQWQGQFYRWNGCIYEVVPDEVLRGQLWDFLYSAKKRVGEMELPFQPGSRNVSEVTDALRSRLALGVECHPPMWLDKRRSARDWIVFQNKVVNTLTEEVRELTPDMWAHSALSFDWDADAECETWLKFLGQVFPGMDPSPVEDGAGVDEQSIDFLEEWMGYCMTEETKFQKGALLIGPKRSGKGTISHVLRYMVGDQSYVGLSFNTWATSENSRAPLIGKRVGVFADVRFKPGKFYGSSYDAGGITHQSAELILNIIGEDTMTIGRKYVGPWHGQLPLKLMLISNEVPNLNDSSGVLPSRFIKLHFPVSFFGKEDVRLREKLERELPGIAVRCVRAYSELCRRGHFVQPDSGLALDRALLAESDPFAAMVMECFEIDHDAYVVRTVAYNKFTAYCEARDRKDLLRSVPENKFGDRLRGVAGFEHVKVFRPKMPETGKQGPRVWLGMKLRSKSKRRPDDEDER